MPPEDTAPESSTGQENSQSYLAEHQGAEVAASPTAADANSPESSTEKTGDKKAAETPSPLDVVKSAMKENAAEGSPSSEGNQANQAGNAEDNPDQLNKAGADDDAAEKEAGEEKPPFHEHPRWKEIVSKNQDLAARVEEFENGDTKVHAENYQQLDTFLKTKNLNADDFNNGLNMMSAFKNDPAAALEMIEPYYNALLKVNGKVLPDDIKQKLDDGVIDNDTAFAMSTDRARNAQLQTQLNNRNQQDQQTVQQQQEADRTKQANDLVSSMKTSVSEWESKWSKGDADYAKLMPHVRDRLAMLAGQKQPNSPEEAVKLADKAKTEILAEFSQFMPQKKPVTNIHGNGANMGNSPATQPKNGLDVVQQALAAQV